PLVLLGISSWLPFLDWTGPFGCFSGCSSPRELEAESGRGPSAPFSPPTAGFAFLLREDWREFSLAAAGRALRRSMAVGIAPKGRMVASTGFVSLDTADHGVSR